MKFKLFLNRLSASQTIRFNKKEADLDCYGACSPYNCSSIPSKENDKPDFLHKLYDNLKEWKVRKENFGYIVYDSVNHRLYETDEDGISCINILRECNSISSFSKSIMNDSRNGNFMNLVKEVYI